MRLFLSETTRGGGEPNYVGVQYHDFDGKLTSPNVLGVALVARQELIRCSVGMG